ncbi:MAG TPA: hypothetical protein VJH75_03785 [Patescibacteria group bacterium]|nr:hypothetical protein [Patescibacteria group bacterium]
MIIGHEKIWEFFNRAAEEGLLSHSYILSGPNQVGKKTLALNIGSKLLNTPVEKLFTNPDFYYLARVEDEKTGKLKQDISISQTRGLRERLVNGSWLKGYQVVIIDEAEKLNEESGNSLLKLLEEPGAKTIFFLITTDEEMVLPTIRSRSQLMRFGLVSEEILKNGLKQLNFPKSATAEVVPLSLGRPGKAIELLQDAEKLAALKQRQGMLRQMLGSTLQENISTVEKIFKDKKEMTREKEMVKELIDSWQVIFRGMLLNPNEQNFSKSTWNSGKIIQALKILQQTRGLLRTNVQPRLLLEQIILNF